MSNTSGEIQACVFGAGVKGVGKRVETGKSGSRKLFLVLKKLLEIKLFPFSVIVFPFLG